MASCAPRSRRPARPETTALGRARAWPTTRSRSGSIPRRASTPRLEEALEIAASLDGTDELAALAVAHTEIGTSRFQLGRAGDGEVDLGRAVEFARRTGDNALVGTR